MTKNINKLKQINNFLKLKVAGNKEISRFDYFKYRSKLIEIQNEFSFENDKLLGELDLLNSFRMENSYKRTAYYSLNSFTYLFPSKEELKDVNNIKKFHSKSSFLIQKRISSNKGYIKFCSKLISFLDKITITNY